MLEREGLFSLLRIVLVHWEFGKNLTEKVLTSKRTINGNKTSLLFFDIFVDMVDW